MYGHENVAAAGTVGMLAMTGGHVSTLVSVALALVAGGLFLKGALRRTRQSADQ